MAKTLDNKWPDCFICGDLADVSETKARKGQPVYCEACSGPLCSLCTVYGLIDGLPRCPDCHIKYGAGIENPE